MNMTDVLLTVSVACNMWFLFLLLYDRIMETRLIRFFRDIARVWNTLRTGELKKIRNDPYKRWTLSARATSK